MLAFALALIAPAAAADAVEVGLDARVQTLADLAWDRPEEDRLEVWTRALADARGPAGAGRWQLGVLFEHQALVGAPAAGGDVEAAVDLRVWESGWEGPVGPARLKVGHFVERWGRLDLLPVTDVLVGRDLRAGLYTPADLVRQPAPLVRLQAGGARARAELTVLPFGARDRIALEGTDAALLRQGQVADALDDAATWEGDPLTQALLQEALAAAADGVDALDAQLRRAAFGSLAASGQPDPLLSAADLALRLEAEPGPVDLALVGAWMRSRRPLPAAPEALAAALRTETLPGLEDQEALLDLVRSPGGLTWPRTWVAGGEVATVLGPVGVRAEGLYQSARAVPRAWGGGALSPSIAGGLGLDWAWGTTLTLVAEARHEALLDAPADLVLAAARDTQIAGGAQVSLAGGRVTLTPGAVALLAWGEVAVQGQAAWRASDAWELSAGAAAALSPAEAPRSVRQALTYTGGPLGALSDTDAAWLTLRWIQ